MKATWSVVMVYEDNEAREAALAFCDRLVERFWKQFGFDTSWWSFEMLQEADGARTAARHSAEADLIVVAARPEGEMPAHIQSWIESWLDHRCDREGALVGLLGQGPAQSGAAAGRDLYLRQVAHRGGLDYLTKVPQSISEPIPDSLDSYSERAGEITSVLDEILHQPPPPSRMMS
jgi:hypothetical protein